MTWGVLLSVACGRFLGERAYDGARGGGSWGGGGSMDQTTDADAGWLMKI